MAYWFPTFNIAGGLYGNTATPSGDLSNFIENAPSKNFTDGGFVCAGTIINYPTDEPHGKWIGAFGSSDVKFRDYGDLHINQGTQNLDIMIFDVKNPEGAQYYKQQLVISGSIDCISRSGGIIGESSYWNTHQYTFYVKTITRRVYATPTSIPETTHTFFTGTMGGVFQYLIEGNEYGPGHLCKNYKFPVTYYEHNNINYFALGMYQESHNVNGGTTYYVYSSIGINTGILQNAFGDFALDENDDPNITPYPDPDPDDDPTPGPGDREKDYDPIPIPPTPGLTAIGAGFITLYSPSSTALNLLADEIFSDNILQIISNYFTSIADVIAGLSIVPFFVPVSGFAHHKLGLFTSSVSLPLVSSQFIDVDCGSVAVNRYFNNFLDYSPNTKILLWLPYIGYQELNVDEVMNNTISIKYRCDILSGACVAFVMIGTGGEGAAASRVIAQFSGNVITQVPTAAQSYDEMVSNAINILTASVGIAAGAAIGGMAGGGTAPMAQATAGSSQAASAIGAQVGMGMGGTAANMVMSMKPTFARNGTPGSTSGYMSVQKPYLIKIVPRDAVAPNHIQLKGYPSNYGGTLGNLSGYCEVSEIHLYNVPATVDEITEIYSLLKGGVII